MEQWNELVANLQGFFDRPVVIGILLGIVAIVVFLVIFSKTSFGRKALNKLSNGFKLLLDKFAKHEEETENKIKQLEEYYEKDKEIAEQKIAILEQLCFVLAENSHNEKVKQAFMVCKEKLALAPTKYDELIENRIKEEKEKIEEEVKAKVTDFYEGYFEEQKSKVEKLIKDIEKVAEIGEKQAKETIEEVSEELESATDTIVEVIENERQEIINTNSEEETLQEN